MFTENPAVIAMERTIPETRILRFKITSIKITKIIAETKYHVPKNAQTAVIIGAMIKNKM